MTRRIGLALGGGGARGLAHLGVLKVLEENRIPINLIAGTSMGSVIGAMYALDPDADKLIERWSTFLKSHDFNSLGTQFITHQNDQSSSLLAQFINTVTQSVVLSLSAARPAILKTKRLADAIASLVPEVGIHNTKIPFTAVTSDLNTGRTVVLDSGSIREAVTISSSIPGFIAPHARNSQLLTDGGVTAAVPVEVARAMGASLVIAVNVSINDMPLLHEPNILTILTRIDTIRGIQQTEQQIAKADIHIHPDVSNAYWSEFNRFEEFVQAGIAATRSEITNIKEKIYDKKNFMQTLFSKLTGKNSL
ncbi:MAG: patatin-like phospholipase family protein [Candidatus Neomarinimicrobiota bacterium]